MKAAPPTIDAYLAPLDATRRATLETLRRDIKAAAPDAEECISYGVPGVRLDGRLLVSFGAAANHCALYPGALAVGVLADDLKGYDTSKGTIRFPVDRPLRAALVRKIVKLCMAELRRKRAARSARPPSVPAKARRAPR